jgi:hypothetical protein
MNKIISIFIIITILGIMFMGCGTKEAAVENNGSDLNTSSQTVITENVIYEDVIVENIIYENIIR